MTRRFTKGSRPAALETGVAQDRFTTRIEQERRHDAHVDAYIEKLEKRRHKKKRPKPKK